MRLFSFFLFGCILFFGCTPKKVKFDVTNNPFEIFPASYKQNVLIEQFVSETKSSTVNANEFLDQLSVSNNRIIPVKLHTNDWLSNPYNDYLATFYGGLAPGASGAVNRQLGFNTNVSLSDSLTFVSTNYYENLLYRQAQKSTPLAISLASQIKADLKGSLDIYIAHKQNFTSDTRIGIYLIQDSIQSIFQAGGDSTYVHHDILREVMSDYAGDPIKLSVEDKQEKITNIKYDNFDLSVYPLAEMKFVVFVYEYNPNFKKTIILNSQVVRIGGNKYWD